MVKVRGWPNIHEKIGLGMYDCAYVHVRIGLVCLKEGYGIDMESPFRKDDLMFIIDGIEDGVVKLDGQSKYVAMNKAPADTFRRLGQDPQTMIGKSVWELFPDVKGTIVERELHKALEDHTSIKFEFLYPGDRHWYEIQGYPSQPGAILVFRDITDRKIATK